jgi:hypothetical protein
MGVQERQFRRLEIPVFEFGATMDNLDGAIYT